MKRCEGGRGGRERYRHSSREIFAMMLRLLGVLGVFGYEASEGYTEYNPNYPY